MHSEWGQSELKFIFLLQMRLSVVYNQCILLIFVGFLFIWLEELLSNFYVQITFRSKLLVMVSGKVEPMLWCTEA